MHLYVSTTEVIGLYSWHNQLQELVLERSFICHQVALQITQEGQQILTIFSLH